MGTTGQPLPAYSRPSQLLWLPSAHWTATPVVSRSVTSSLAAGVVPRPAQFCAARPAVQGLLFSSRQASWRLLDLPLWAQPTRFSPRSANVSKHRAWASCPPSIIRGARRDSELTRCPRTLTAPLVVPPCRVTTPTSRGGEWTGGLASRRDGGSLKRRPGGLASCAGPST
jgi:hypothetical protein